MDTNTTGNSTEPRRSRAKILGASTAVAVAGLLGLGVMSANAAETGDPADSSVSAEAPDQGAEAGAESTAPEDGTGAQPDRGERDGSGAGCDDAGGPAPEQNAESDTDADTDATAETSLFTTT
ncbi:hypothetical protein [Zhihengliuella halotolerans]|uniref:Uncharacterized protein n=1 Tax=Zhihengliuella halotolerans TaxID=370736 RepID=A0A4Q8AF59_9MICC|nr:hypothetical protein [Zhihengliuella halotolerans]RZU62937.1 hypothetical protein EV380_2542 [Zhihengliuella halotolerans]